MARVIIKAENQLQRINQLKTAVESFQKLDNKTLQSRPSEKSWSVIEVLEHMVRGHEDYIQKIDQTLANLQSVEAPLDKLKTSAIPSFLIKRFPPKEEKIKFKMKTMKRFIPVFENETLSETDIEKVFARFYQSLNHLNDSINAYRVKNVKSIKFNSAVGGWVKFNVAEACEFIICHNERHLQQMKNVLEKINRSIKPNI